MTHHAPLHTTPKPTTTSIALALCVCLIIGCTGTRAGLSIDASGSAGNINGSINGSIGGGNSGSSGNNNGTSGGTSGGNTTKKLHGTRTTTEKATGERLLDNRYQSQLPLNRIIVDGVAIDLLPAQGGNTFTQIDDTFNNSQQTPITKTISGNDYQSRFGLLEYNRRVTAFSQGEATQTLPIGYVRYVGRYVGYDHTAETLSHGTVSASVNFAQKTVSMRTTNDSAYRPNQAFSGQIIGNYFTLTAPNAQGQGHFYGSRASEMGGTFTHDNDYTGAFGAKKQ